VSETRLASLAAELRRDFDRGFAEPWAAESVRPADFLAIRLGGAAFALRLADLSGVSADRPVTPLPGAPAELVGISSVRGALVPVWDLRLLFGMEAAGAPRWMALLVAPSPLGLGFDSVDGYLRVYPERVTAAGDRERAAGPRGAGLVRSVLRADTQLRPVVDAAAIIEQITRRARRKSAPEEAGT
jgi:purine-binding chemotaxis protein CheW